MGAEPVPSPAQSGGNEVPWQQKPANSGDEADSREVPDFTDLPGLVESCAENASTPCASSASAPDRPTDDQIIEYENTVRAETADKPFVGDVEPLSALEAEYETGSEVFRQKIKSLEASYSAMRRARGDGNCFFRGFIFGYLEHLVRTNATTERSRVAECIGEWRQKLIDGGVQELVFEDAMEVLLNQLNAIGDALPEPLSVASLEANMRDGTISNMVVMFLRILTSCEIQRREDFFMPFILGMSDDGLSVEQFRRRCVEPMGEESDHVHIVALTDALQVPIRVLYLDRSLALGGGYDAGAESAAVNHHDFVPASCVRAAAPRSRGCICCTAPDTTTSSTPPPVRLHPGRLLQLLHRNPAAARRWHNQRRSVRGRCRARRRLRRCWRGPWAAASRNPEANNGSW